MSRVIAIVACGLSVAACSASMPSLDFLKSSPQTEALAIETEPPGAEAKASTGQSCRTPCQLTVQPGGELSVTLALNGYQPQTVSVREAEGTSKLAPNPGLCRVAAGRRAVGAQAGCEEEAGHGGRAQAGAVSDRIGRAAFGDRIRRACADAGTSRCAGACGVRRAGSVRDQLSLAVAIATAPGW